MKKSKKNKPRPAWTCPKCKIYWVSCEPACVICKSPGVPMNEGAEKILGKRDGDTWTKNPPQNRS